jgi:hypothetical protein
MPQRNSYRSSKGRSAIARKAITTNSTNGMLPQNITIITTTGEKIESAGYFGGNKKGGAQPSATGFMRVSNRATSNAQNANFLFSFSTNNSIEETWDLIIIGAGICGAQIATRYMEDFPDGKVLILDSGNQVGGVLRSLPQSNQIEGGEDNLVYRAADMGAMRFFPDAMPVVSNLVSTLELTPLNISVTTPKTYLYAFGKRDLVTTLGNTWTLYGSNPSYNPIANVENDSETILADIFNVETYDTTQLALYSNRILLNSRVELSEKSYPALTIPFKSSFAVGIDFDRITGYRGLIFGPTAAAVSLTETVTIGQSSQISVKEGTQYIVIKMFEKLNSTIKNLNNSDKDITPKKGVHIILGATVNNIDRFGRIAIIQTTGNSGFDNTSQVLLNTRQIITKGVKIAITAHPSSLANMLKNNASNLLNNNYINRLNRSFLYFNGLKLFLRYETSKAWWIDTEFRNSGRHLTETYIGQLWFYDDNTLLMYNVGTDAEYWADLFKQKEWKQRLDDKFNTFGEQEETSEWWTAFKTFANDIIPDFSSKELPTHYALSIYSDQVPIWKELEIGESIVERREKFRYPFKNNNNIAWAHNAISLYQGWMEGSLEEANVLYDGWNL